MATDSHHDAVIVGGGHNGLVAAAYLARAGRSVLLLERLDAPRRRRRLRAAVRRASTRACRATPTSSACCRSRSSTSSGCRFGSRRRRDLLLHARPARRPARGLLVDARTAPRTAASFARRHRRRRATRGLAALLRDDARAWRRRVFPTLTEPLRPRDELRALVGDDAAWEALFERPLGEPSRHGLRRRPRARRRAHRRADRHVRRRRTTRPAPEPLLPLPRDRRRHRRLGRARRRHGRASPARWRGAARGAGAELRTGAEVTAIDTGRPTVPTCASPTRRRARRRRRPRARNAAPARARPPARRPRARRARPRAPSSRSTCCSRGCRGCATPPSTPREAFAGTFHVNETLRAARSAPTRRPAAGDDPGAAARARSTATR